MALRAKDTRIMKIENIIEEEVPAKPARIKKIKVVNINCDYCGETIGLNHRNSNKCLWCLKDICSKCINWKCFHGEDEDYPDEFCEKCIDLADEADKEITVILNHAHEECDRIIDGYAKIAKESIK